MIEEYIIYIILGLAFGFYATNEIIKDIIDERDNNETERIYQQTTTL